MKHILWGVVAATAMACGGGAKTPEQPQPKRACAVMAENLAGAILAVEGIGLREDQRPAMVRVFTERCDTDAWADDVVACMTNAKMSSQGDDLEACADMLSQEQDEAIKEHLEREGIVPDGGNREMDQGDAKGAPAPGGGAPPPPPPPPDDPCGGGA